MKYISSRFCKVLIITLGSIILIGNLIASSVVGDPVLTVTPSHGPPGTEITVSANIKNDVLMEYWNDYYGLEFKVVWNIRPADIINPNLWGYENPIGTANIDNNGWLSGTATIPLYENPGTYNIFAAYERYSGDPFHVYWSNTFTVDGGTSTNDEDGDEFPDYVDDFPDDPIDTNQNNNTPGFELLIVFVSILIILILSYNKKYYKKT